MFENLKTALRFGKMYRDEHGFSTGSIVGVVVGGFIAILIALILVPTVTNQAYLLSKNVTTIGDATHAGVPGALGLIQLVGIMFLIVAVVLPVILALYVLKQVD